MSTTPRTLRRKLETGIVAFLKTLDAAVLERYQFNESSIARKRKLPGFSVKASGETECFGDGSPKRVRLEIVMLTSLDDAFNGDIPDDDTRAKIREDHDEALAPIEAALEAPGAPAALMALLNRGAAKRPVANFHFYDITKMDEQPMGGDGRQYADGLTFEVVCQNCDG